VKKLLNKNFEPSEEEVVNRLGNSVNALYSVPTAIYTFLKCSPLARESRRDAFRKTLEYTIGLGGDVDTITSMSCSLAGSLYGDDSISENLVKHLEAYDEMISLADKLYNVVESS
jgi:poly(ADP-ribose) glycohydrolase ARH3